MLRSRTTKGRSVTPTHRLTLMHDGASAFLAPTSVISIGKLSALRPSQWLLSVFWIILKQIFIIHNYSEKCFFSKLKQHYVNRRLFFSDPFEIEMILITTRNSCMSDLAVACIAALIYVWIWIKWNWLRKQLGDLRGGRRTLEHRCNIDIRFCINM